jgi:signal transduction histidine kinase
VTRLQPGGRITASAKNVELAAVPAAELDVAPGRYVRVSVIDDGCGIDADTLTHVWEPFFTTKPPGEGGLGLATVYGIARQAGGGVAIKSTIGRGTRVDVYIPATDRVPDRREARPEPEPSIAGARILLVEDEASVRDVMRRILERAG